MQEAEFCEVCKRPFMREKSLNWLCKAHSQNWEVWPVLLMKSLVKTLCRTLINSVHCAHFGSEHEALWESSNFNAILLVIVTYRLISGTFIWLPPWLKETWTLSSFFSFIFSFSLFTYYLFFFFFYPFHRSNWFILFLFNSFCFLLSSFSSIFLLRLYFLLRFFSNIKQLKLTTTHKIFIRKWPDIYQCFPISTIPI